MFGEESISDLSPIQSKLLSLSHLYDVVQSSIGVHDSYGEDKTEIPQSVKPYPGKLMKWYEQWQEKTRGNGRGNAGKSKSGGRAKTILKDDETDAQAFSAYISAMKAREKK